MRGFSKEFLLNVLWGSNDSAKKISDTIVSHGRWSVGYKLIFRIVEDPVRYYSVLYSIGATESQDEGPFEYDKDPILCHEVVPVEETVIVYKEIREGNS
jgi:hypothetical protein